MLHAYIDESSRDGLYVMAGYLAPRSNWSALAAEWTQLLGLGPPHFRKVAEVKMSEMTSPLGLEQCELFYRIIEKHVLAQVSCCVKLEDLKAAHSRMSWPHWLDNVDILINEHYNAFDAIVRGLALESHRIGINEPVDIVFDEHSSSTKCLRAWRILKNGGHPDVVGMLGNVPTFEDSKVVPPLQAADMLAYWVRTTAHAKREAADPQATFPWQRRVSIPGIHIYFEPGMIERNFRNAVLACSLARHGVPPWIISAIVTP